MTAALAFVALVAVLAGAMARWERLPDWAVAAGAAALLVLVGSISAGGARDTRGPRADGRLRRRGGGG